MATGRGILPLLVAIFFFANSPAKADFVGHGAPVRDIEISTDGQFAATAGFDDLAILWSVATREQLTRFYGHAAGVNAVAFLPAPTDGSRPRVVTVSDDGTARIWDGNTGKVLHVLEGHAKKVVAVAVSPDGKTIATGSWDRSVRLWDAETGAAMQVFTGHSNSVNDVIFTADGTAVVSAGYDGDVRVWSLDPSIEPYRFAKVGFPINSIALSSDGETLVTGSSDQTVRVWDFDSRQLRRELSGHHTGAVLSVAISGNGKAIASGGVGGTLLLWDAGSEPRITLQVEHYRAVWALTFSPDGDRIFAGGIDAVARGWYTSDGRSVIGDTTRFKPVERVSRALAQSEDPAERGSYQYRKCAICHSLTDDGIERSGPTLAGLFGRQAGTLPGYGYSDALSGSDVIWGEETIDRLFDIGPDQMFPGTKMPVQRLTNPRDRADLVEFLRQATEQN